MPANYDLGLDENQCLLPAWPNPPQDYPERSVGGGKSNLTIPCSRIFFNPTSDSRTVASYIFARTTSPTFVRAENAIAAACRKESLSAPNPGSWHCWLACKSFKSPGRSECCGVHPTLIAFNSVSAALEKSPELPDLIAAAVKKVVDEKQLTNETLQALGKRPLTIGIIFNPAESPAAVNLEAEIRVPLIAYRVRPTKSGRT
jgi:hypothetical protein